MQIIGKFFYSDSEDCSEYTIVAFNETNGHVVISRAWENWDHHGSQDDDFDELNAASEWTEIVLSKEEIESIEYEDQNEALEKKYNAAVLAAFKRGEELADSWIGCTANGVSIHRHPTATHSHRPDLDREAIRHLNIQEGQTFLRETIDMGRVIGEDHLVETDKEDEIFFMTRGNRPGQTRFVLSKQAKATSKVTIVACVDQDPGPTQGLWCLVTLFEGEPGEREPWDTSLNTPEAKAKAEAFWSTHALVPTEAELDQIIELI